MDISTFVVAFDPFDSWSTIHEAHYVVERLKSLRINIRVIDVEDVVKEVAGQDCLKEMNLGENQSILTVQVSTVFIEWAVRNNYRWMRSICL